MKRICLILFLILVTAVSCSAKYRNMQSFETVWQTVNEKHYDPTIGVDVRWMEGDTVITAVKPGSAADAAGCGPATQLNK